MSVSLRGRFSDADHSKLKTKNQPEIAGFQVYKRETGIEPAIFSLASSCFDSPLENAVFADYDRLLAPPPK